jgi:transcriptional regulator with XRE-family HTH domain
MADRDATYDLATYLQQTMAEKAISVRELAEIAGLDPYQISQVLRGTSRLSLDDARKIADALDVPYQTVAMLAATE